MRAQRPLNPAAVQAANQKLWEDNPELNERQLTMGPEDYEYRREWMAAYQEALAEENPPPPTSGRNGRVGDSSRPCPAAPQTNRAGAISDQQARNLFLDMASQNQIPFDYPYDCCYSRAHEMRRLMGERGIQSRKVWNYAHDFASGGNSLSVNTPAGHINWRYHVAPVVAVCGDDGITRDMVLDPSLFDRPVTVQEWVQRQGDPSSTSEITDSRYYFRVPGNTTAIEDPDYTQTSEMLAEHRYNRDLLR